MRFVLVTGMSGAGQSSALKTLKDAGFLEEEIKKIFYRNVLRVYQDVLKEK